MSNAAVALVANSTTKTFFVGSQAEPDLYGYDLLALLKTVLTTAGSEATVKAQVVALQGVPGRRITQAEFDTWKVNHPTVTTISQFYIGLAAIQGDVSAMLSWGVYEDYVAFTGDTGYQQLDWGYVVDFDTRVFEIYRGWQVKPPTRGRLVGVSINTQPGFRQNYPLQMVSSWTFAQVATLSPPTRWWAN